MDFETISQVRQEANNNLRNLMSLEEITLSFKIEDYDDPMLYGLYLAINKDKLFQHETKILNETIDILKQKEKKNNDYNYKYLQNNSPP